MAFDFTNKQKEAINAKGNVLVAAAAGSGKTAVLVERVITRLMDKVNPISADRLLIVTFTNAAAAEMRARIEKRLEEECKKEPKNVGLIKQRQQIYNAKICTIDSFCIDLVRENFEKAGVAPDFKISDGYSLKPIDEQVIGSIVGDYFKENSPVFLELLDIVGAEYDESNFIQLVLDLYNYSRQMPFPEKWFDSLEGMYNNGTFDPQCKWYQYAIEKSVKISKKIQNTIANTVDMLMTDEKSAQQILPFFLQAAEHTNELYNAANNNDWDGVYESLNSFIIPSLPRSKAGYEVNNAKAVWGYIKKDLDNLKKLFYADIKTINRQFNKLDAPIKLLVKILKEFQERLFQEYLQRNTFTFHNIEHLALSLLCDKNGNPTESAEEIISRFDEVMVDEYQDTNNLQNMLFYVLSHKGSRLFAVGDVKQSIYGFRGANPENFLNRKNNAESLGIEKIILSDNFRCKKEVCQYINFVFQNLMTENTGKIIYDNEEALSYAAEYPETDSPAVEFDIIQCKGYAEEKFLAEVNHIGDFIKKTMASGECIRVDKDTMRKARYSDFTVLLRSAKDKAPIMASEFRRMGIPVDYSTDGFADAYEIAIILSLLKIIDNPDSDIELLSVLMSPIFAFTTDQAAKLRINHRKGSLYSAVVFAANNGDDSCLMVLEKLKKYRLLGVTLPIQKLISRLLEETDWLNIASAMTDGTKRRNNLLLLVSYAEQYFSNVNGGAGNFVKYIIKQSKSGMKAAAVTSGADTVKIMSIHASKGLQFPVCIIADTSAEFNDSESRSSYIYSTDLGIGLRYFDEDKKEKTSTVSREVILDEIRQKTCEEELRLLYVAMTRTQDKLLITSTVTDIEKTAAECNSLLESYDGRADLTLSNAKSYGKMLILTALNHPDGKALRGEDSRIIPWQTDSRFKLNLIYSAEETEVNEVREEEKPCDQKLTQKIKEAVAYKYPYEELTKTQSKASVSVIANKAESDKYVFSVKPAFMSDGGINANERGTAMHKVIEFFDFDKWQNVEEELNRLYEWQFISEREYKAVNRRALNDFFASKLFQRIRNAKTVKKEMRFITQLSATELNANLDELTKEEKVIVQGAVDLCFVEDDSLVILDFKTDRVKEENSLKENYGRQLEIYANACEKIFQKPIKERIIWSFALSKEISC